VKFTPPIHREVDHVHIAMSLCISVDVSIGICYSTLLTASVLQETIGKAWDPLPFDDKSLETTRQTPSDRNSQIDSSPSYQKSNHGSC
jgi:hypothetical protein